MMTPKTYKLRIVAVFAIVVVGFIGLSSHSHPAFATSIKVSGIYSASLSGSAEVPNVNTQATGDAVFKSNAQAAAAGGAAAAASSGDKLSYTVDVNDIDQVTGSHIHMGKSGDNGPIIVTLFDPQTPTGKVNGELTSGTITAHDLSGPMKGKQLSDLLDLFEQGEAYVNVHTQNHPKGEIRGQIQE